MVVNVFIHLVNVFLDDQSDENWHSVLLESVKNGVFDDDMLFAEDTAEKQLTWSVFLLWFWVGN